MTDLRPLVEAQLVEADRCRWSDPQHSLTLARAAYAATDQSSPLHAACAITQCAVLNTLGQFGEALSLLETINPPADWAARCYSERVIACTYRGQLAVAQAALTQARAAQAGPLSQAWVDRAEGILRREQTQLQAACEVLQRAVEVFTTLDRPGDTLATRFDLAVTLLRLDPTLARAEHARLCTAAVVSQSTHAQACCAFVLGGIEEQVNQYASSLDLFRAARQNFAAVEAVFWVSLCDLNLGIAYERLNRYEEALAAYQQAEAALTAQRLPGYATLCKFNAANCLLALNRYTAALDVYQRVTEAALADGRALRAAYSQHNTALCHDRLGHYDQAIALYERARRAFETAGQVINVVLCNENLAGTYRRLGRHAEALAHYRAARETLTHHNLPLYVARCETHLADLYLTLKQYEGALACLTHTRAIYAEHKMEVYAATCDREIARALIGAHHLDRWAEAIELLAQARAVLQQHGLLVDVALCDIATGEAYAQQRQFDRAEQSFATALVVLDPAFPDEAWRAYEGLGQCALHQSQPDVALSHWLSAVRRVQQVRARLQTEQLSGGFFAGHQALHEAALRLAIQFNQFETALIIGDAAKAQTHAGWQVEHRPEAVPDTYAAHLIEREAVLRRQLDEQRRALRVLQADDAGPILRAADKLAVDQPAALTQLTDLSREYEQIIEQLRLLQPRQFDQGPIDLSVVAVRAGLNRLAGPWAVLAYTVLDDAIAVIYLDDQRLTAYLRPLSALDRQALRQCATPTADYRELIYRGTLHGHHSPSATSTLYLQRLYQLLIPPEVADLPAEATLIIAPHGALHALPFQALLAPERTPLARRPVCNVPSLAALLTLLNNDQSAQDSAQPRALLCGLAHYGGKARALPQAEREIAALRDVWADRCETRWGEAATRAEVLRLNGSGQLADYEVIHFTAHAVLDALAPSQSRVLLADEALTFADILNLRLTARVVVLAACDGALGAPQAGDELLALARAFFYAGARSVIASLWPVEDAATAELMRHVHAGLTSGQTATHALHAAQQILIEAGYTPYQWAAFVVIGAPA
ncbi:MAG: CHAT domain-containing protein [Thermoflexales bacterium]|nr:CHAT domain-containing protein [Thermoflexales bacterium]